MKYIWTEDTGAGLHYWQLVNHYLLKDIFIVETKQSNQGLIESVRNIDLSLENIKRLKSERYKNNRNAIIAMQ